MAKHCRFKKKFFTTGLSSLGVPGVPFECYLCQYKFDHKLICVIKSNTIWPIKKMWFTSPNFVDPIVWERGGGFVELTLLGTPRILDSETALSLSQWKFPPLLKLKAYDVKMQHICTYGQITTSDCVPCAAVPNNFSVL